MSNIQIAVSAADAAVTAPATLTSGMVGATVTFAFSGTAWQSLRKIAVFRAGSVRRDVEETDWSGSVCTIPWECLSEADERLLVGVYGMDEAGTVVIPTVYADCGWIWPGADPAGDPAADPTCPFYAGLLAEALEKAKASGAFDGPAGPQGDKGDPGDSYTVKGLYATLADLQAAHPTGSAGDAWFVGTEDSNVVYQWDVDKASWVNVGALKGPKGDKGDTGLKGEKGDNGDPGIVISATQPTAESHPVWINPEGEASPAGGTDISLGVTSATVGQIAKITAVDDSGKPTAWEAVDDRLPNASPSKAGKVLAVEQTGEFEYGYGFADMPKMYDFINLGIDAASPGQFAKVAHVDDFGHPSSWEAVDMPSGGSMRWQKIKEITLEAQTNDIVISEDDNGVSVANYNPIAMKVEFHVPADSTQTNANGAPWIYPSATCTNTDIRAIGSLASWKTVTRRQVEFFIGDIEGIFAGGNTNAQLVPDPQHKPTITVMDGVTLRIYGTADHWPVGTIVSLEVLSERA